MKQLPVCLLLDVLTKTPFRTFACATKTWVREFFFIFFLLSFPLENYNAGCTVTVSITPANICRSNNTILQFIPKRTIWDC